MSNGRKVHTDALETLGTIIDEKAKRDAIHIAVLPCIAAERLHAGQDVGLVNNEASAKTDKPLGIVDPYLKVPVQKGEHFWLLIYPRVVTSLRHVWSHPEIANEMAVDTEALANARAVVEQLANQADISFETMMEYAKEYIDDGNYAIDGGRWEGVYADDKFWNAYEVLTGTKVSNDQRGGIFSCSC